MIPLMRAQRQRQTQMVAVDATLDFMRLLWAIENRLQSTSKRMASTLGITGPQRLVLKVVAQQPGISAREVADLLRLHPSTITGILQRLSDKGLLLRARDPVDARRVRLRVQPRGRKFTVLSTGTVESAVERALRNMTPAAIRSARIVLGAIATALGDDAQSR
jgi:DNA-binding MarR family transcriptional regulator